MAVFNSLGSNYNLKYVLKSLFGNSVNKNRELKNFLEKKYEGRAILTYKGRQALTLALKILSLPKKTGVAINGFTCLAVYKAIEKAGFTPVCLDLEEKNSDLNFTPEAFEAILKENTNIKVVVIQNTLGYPCNIQGIARICNEKNIILIEDLAHCIGTKYLPANATHKALQAGDEEKEAGSVGDFVVLSFSQDKVIDAVSGGALVIRNKKYDNKIIWQPARIATQSVAGGFNNINNLQQLKDRLYPSLTYKIRFLYNLVLGKPLHFLLKNLNLLSKPMQEHLYDFYSLPNWYCNLALSEFNNLSSQLNHRKEIARIYANNLDKKILQSRISNKINLSSNLRFPIFVENRNSLINFLKRFKIFISDIWYDDVAPECPNAVGVSKKILNLPTHINVTKKDALKIAERINEWSAGRSRARLLDKRG